MTAPPVTSAGKNILQRRPGAATGRHPGARTTSPSGRRGQGCVSGGRGVAAGQAPIRVPAAHQPGTGSGRAGPGRSAARPADPLPAMASDPGWAEHRGAASARPALGARTTRAVMSRSSACCSRHRVAAWPARVPGRGRRCVPCGEHGPHDLSRLAWRGVAPQVAERADHLQPAAGLGQRTGGPRHRHRCCPGRRPRTAPRAPAAAGRAGPAAGDRYRRARAGRAAARWSSSPTPRSRCPGCCAPCPTGATWPR